jgi:hypothetical protein
MPEEPQFGMDPRARFVADLIFRHLVGHSVYLLAFKTKIF